MQRYINKIVHSDNMDILKNLSDECIDMIVTSPPYNLDIDYNSHEDNIPYDEYLEWCFKWISECSRVLKHSGRIAINIPMENNIGTKRFICNDYINILDRCNLLQTAFILWDKHNHVTRRTAWGSWKSPSCPVVNTPFECILVYSKGSKKKIGDKDLIDITDREFIDWTLGVWKMQPEMDRTHPAPFPIELPKRVIKLFTYKNDVVMDPFSGSGTTAIACRNLNRRFICIEKDKAYYEKSIERFKNTFVKRGII